MGFCQNCGKETYPEIWPKTCPWHLIWCARDRYSGGLSVDFMGGHIKWTKLAAIVDYDTYWSPQ
ncbi:MAG: hypothetical protein IT210_05595 [Armatimonadetes bacterium]|nr:hypothetical protein [Armatimonadota bacterium]